jgi:hypothetical protein
MIEWGFSVYFFFAEGKPFTADDQSSCGTYFASSAILIWRLYALYNQSKRILCVLLGLFLPIVALSIGADTYLYSRRKAFSGEFWLGSSWLQADFISFA